MHFPSIFGCILLAFAHSSIASPLKEASQKKQVQYHVDVDRADAVKEIFKFAWDGYYKYAFPHDELHPVSKTPGDSR
jgi:mannosyl-oligosaccharide alpha-1,2-mannosidase